MSRLSDYSVMDKHVLTREIDCCVKCQVRLYTLISCTCFTCVEIFNPFKLKLTRTVYKYSVRIVQ
jgi:hypothetical protein